MLHFWGVDSWRQQLYRLLPRAPPLVAQLVLCVLPLVEPSVAVPCSRQLSGIVGGALASVETALRLLIALDSCGCVAPWWLHALLPFR